MDETINGIPIREFNVMGHKAAHSNPNAVRIDLHDRPREHYLEIDKAMVQAEGHGTKPEMDYLKVNPSARVKIHHLHGSLQGALTDVVEEVSMDTVSVLAAVKPIPESDPCICKPIPAGLRDRDLSSLST